MASFSSEPPIWNTAKTWVLPTLALLSFLLLGCGGPGDGASQDSSAESLDAVETTPSVAPTELATPLVDLELSQEDITIEPLPLRAGFPFTVTSVIHNNAEIPAEEVPFMVYLSANQEEIGYSPFLQILTVTVPASQSLPVDVPVDWNLNGGEHQLWIQVNRLPDAWQQKTPTQPEAETGDNIARLAVMVDPFDAYTSDLCSGRVDVEIGPADVLPEPDRQRVRVRVHNMGNSAVYNLPVVVTGDRLSGISYTPAIPPCGGTAEVTVGVDRPFEEGESLTVQINPAEWVGGLEENSFDNNLVSVSAGLAPGMVLPPGSGLDDYDFSLTTADIETPELWIVLVTVHNLGTRDADMVPIRVENESGRRIVDAIPLVQGEGIGVAAMTVGYLWLPGGTLTFTVNPQDVKGAYPEAREDNNVATFTLP
jgi:hypothetical protein